MLTGELKICRIDRIAGSCDGNDEVFMLVEKVGKSKYAHTATKIIVRIIIDQGNVFKIILISNNNYFYR